MEYRPPGESKTFGTGRHLRRREPVELTAVMSAFRKSEVQDGGHVQPLKMGPSRHAGHETGEPVLEMRRKPVIRDVRPRGLGIRHLPAEKRDTRLQSPCAFGPARKIGDAFAPYAFEQGALHRLPRGAVLAVVLLEDHLAECTLTDRLDGLLASVPRTRLAFAYLTGEYLLDRLAGDGGGKPDDGTEAGNRT